MNARALAAHDAHLLPLTPTDRATRQAKAPAQRASASIDLAAACAHFEDPTLGVVPLWLLDAKPRRSAIIVPLVAAAWEGGRLVARVEARAAALHAAGVSVLLVDTRRCSLALRWLAAAGAARVFGWWRMTDEPFVRAATTYLEERGFRPDEIGVDRAA